MSIEDRTVVGMCVVETLLVRATYSGKPDTSAILLSEKTTAHWAWEMVRVVCKHPLNLPGATLGGGVLCSRVAQTGSCFGGSE